MDFNKVSITDFHIISTPGESDTVFLLSDFPVPNTNRLFGWGNYLILQFSAPEGLGKKYLNDFFDNNAKV